MEELQVLEEQLEELLEEGAIDPEDALEIALVAGLAARAGSNGALMGEALAWKAGPGRDLLAEAWSLLDHETIVGEFDAVTDGTAEDEAVEEALLDIDELIAGAIWCGKQRLVAPIAKHVSDSVRMMPEVFATLQPDAAGLVALEPVGLEYTLYDFWFTISRSAVASD